MDQNQIFQQQADEDQRQRDAANEQHPADRYDAGDADLFERGQPEPPTDLPEDLFERDETEPPVDEYVTNESVDAEVPIDETGVPESVEPEPSSEEITAPDTVETRSVANDLAENELPSQDELNELVTDVTTLGLDDDVLGRDGMLEAVRDAEDVEAKGGSYLEGFTSSIERQMSDRHPDPVEAKQPGVEPAPPSDRDNAFERYMDHKDKLEASRAGGSWHRDSIDAYHRMGMTYNAYVAGEKIDGLPVTKVDVFLSGVRFYQSNIIETAIIRAVKFACSTFSDKQEGKIETEQNLSDKGVDPKGPLRDNMGALDSGDATTVSSDEVKSVRKDIPEYGMDYGIDTTKGTTYNSTDNLKIYHPTDTVGKVDIGDGKTLNVPGMRMVDIDGTRALVGPDGKVAHESIRNETGLSDGDKSRIESRCDVFESRSAKEQFNHMAESRGVSVEDLKAQYTEKAMDAYASRIENQMLTEANRLETSTIPEARNELNTFERDYSKLDKLETAISRGGVDSGEMKPGEIQNLKAELRSGIEQVEGRISAMEDRVELLRDVHAQTKGATIEDRFSRAVSTEDNAVGRACQIEYVKPETITAIDSKIDAGTEKIVADVEKYSIANPESAVSYDADSGELYNKFGVSESGRYDEQYATVEKSELPSDNPDSIQEHISKHIDTDFDKYREFDPNQQDAPKDVETEQQDTETQSPDTATEAEQLIQPETDLPPEATPADTTPESELPANPEVEQSAETPQGETLSDVEQQQSDADAPPEEVPQSTPDETPVDTEPPSDAAVETVESEDSADVNAEDVVTNSGLTAEQLPEDPSSIDEKRPPAVESGTDAEDETEAKVAAAHDDEANRTEPVKPDDETLTAKPDETTLPKSDEASDIEAGDSEISDKVHEILDTYFNDTEGLVAPEDDVVKPILELFENPGENDFKEIFDSIAEVMAGQDNVEDQIGKFTDLVENFIDASPVPAEAYDMFGNSMLESGVPTDISEAAMDHILSPDLVAQPLEPGIEAQVTIGDQDLTIWDTGIFDTYTDEAAGGFPDEQTADRFFEQADQALYDTGTGVEFPDMGMESGTPFDTESLMPDFETIQPPDVTTGDDFGFSTDMPETAVDVPGGIEGVEAIEGGAAVEGIEAAAAALL